MDSSAGNDVNGLSFGLCSDPAVITAGNVDFGTDLIGINQGNVPDFLVAEFEAGGFTLGMIVSLTGMALIPPGADIEMFVASYDAVGPVGSTTSLDFCNTLGAPTVEVVIVSGGAQIIPVTNSGLAEIEVPAPFSFALDSPFVAVPGQTVDAFVTMSNTGPVEAFSFGLVSDASQLTLGSATASGVLGATNGGAGPDFLQVSLGGASATVECTISTGGTPDSITAGTLQEILVLSYNVDAAAGPPCSTTAIDFSDAVGVAITATSGGIMEPAGTGGNEIEIGITTVGPPSGGITLSAEVVGVVPGDPASAAVLLDTDTLIEAISFGLTYDDSDVSLLSVSMGSSLADLRCGSGPEFFYAETTTVGGPGMILGAVFAISPPLAGRALNPGSGHEIAVLDFSTSASPVGSGSLLEFTSTLGSFPTAVEVSVDGQAITPATTNGEIVLGASSPFMRGNTNNDAQLDLADAITLLNYLFPVGPPQSIDCEDAFDANDDGAIDVADGVAILNYLFGGDPDLPNPSQCGIDPTPDTMICNSLNNCP